MQLVWFCDEILPIIQSKHPEVCFKIVGDKPGPDSLGSGTKKGRSGHWPGAGRSTLSLRIFGARGALPIRRRDSAKDIRGDGDGTAGCLDHQGAEGLEITDGVNILLADTPEDFAGCICALIADPQLGSGLE